MELALIAFDGLDPRVIYNNIENLPNLRELTENSMHGKWGTPGHTIPSFTAALSGRVYNNCNFHWDKGKGNYQRHRQTGFDYMWECTDASMSILNSPILYPPEDIEDAMVCGFLAPDDVVESNLAKPNELQKVLNEMDYMHDIRSDGTYEEQGGEKMYQELMTMMDTRIEAADKMMEMYDSDIFHGVWTAPDRWFHQCTVHDEDYMKMYRKVDEVVGGIMDILPEDVPKVFFSDHGFAHFDGELGVHKGHMHDGWYSIKDAGLPKCRDDSLSIYDLFPTVINYFGEEVDPDMKGRIIFHAEGQEESVKDRLKDLGYME